MGRWLPPIAWLGLTALLTLTPDPLSVDVESVPDFLAVAGHFMLFGVLTWLWLQATLMPSSATGTPFFLTLGILLILAALDEWAQSRVQARTSSWIDLAADAAGILSFAAVWRWRRPALARSRS
jgi:hypothetical protein